MPGPEQFDPRARAEEAKAALEAKRASEEMGRLGASVYNNRVDVSKVKGQVGVELGRDVTTPEAKAAEAAALAAEQEVIEEKTGLRRLLDALMGES